MKKCQFTLTLLAIMGVTCSLYAEDPHEEKPNGEHHNAPAPAPKPAPQAPSAQAPKAQAIPAPVGAIPHPGSVVGGQSHQGQPSPAVNNGSTSAGFNRDQGHADHDHGFHGGERPDHWDHPRFHLIDPYWMEGYWYEGWFANLYGWWWIVGGQHYLYDAPIYPYPTEISSMVLDGPPPPPPSAYTVPTQGQNVWYYCDNPPGYYPYVQSCPTPFRAVMPH